MTDKPRVSLSRHGSQLCNPRLFTVRSVKPPKAYGHREFIEPNGAMRCFTRRSAALRAEPQASQAKPAAAIARRNA